MYLLWILPWFWLYLIWLFFFKLLMGIFFAWRLFLSWNFIWFGTENVLVQIEVQELAWVNKPHLILTFVKEGKICKNKIVDLFKLINAFKLYQKSLPFSFIWKFIWNIKLLKIRLEHLLKLSSFVPGSQAFKSNLFDLHLELRWLWIALFMKSVSEGGWIKSFTNRLLDQLQSCKLLGPSHIVPRVGVNNFKVVPYVLFGLRL